MLMLALGVDIRVFRLVAATTVASPDRTGAVQTADGTGSRKVSGSSPMTSIIPSPSRSAHPSCRRVAGHIASPLAIITQAPATGLQVTQFVLAPSKYPRCSVHVQLLPVYSSNV